jgi:predicted TIM-barrel fold metal-dependent hydrolase
VGVVDFHIHLGRREHLTPRFLEYFERETAGSEALEFVDRLTPEAFIEFLREQGVERAVLLSEYSPKVTGIIPNEFTAKFCNGADQLIPFGSIDLNSDLPPAAQTERAVKELGCRGIKLYPSYSHFYPDDPRLLPVYEMAQDLGVPVMFHTGTSLFPGSRIRYAHPLLLDPVADEFPDLTVVMCHAGRPFWYKEADWMLRRHRNVHVDISGIPPGQLPQIFPKMDEFSDRFIFGSDWPTVPSIAPQLKQIRELPVSQRTIDAILWENAMRLLHLDG